MYEVEEGPLGELNSAQQGLHIRKETLKRKKADDLKMTALTYTACFRFFLL